MQKILIIDFGSQVTQLIARRVREVGVYCEIHPFNKITIDIVKDVAPRGIILSGGPASVYEKNAPTIDKEILHMNIPILAICYGQQLVCHLLGGEVVANEKRGKENEDNHPQKNELSSGEFGRAKLSFVKNSKFTDGVWQNIKSPVVWMSHADKVKKMPSGFEVIATSMGAPYAIVANEAKDIYAVQFHPEVVHTQNGYRLFENFVKNICGCKNSWSMVSFKQNAFLKIKKQVGNNKVVCALSGGVDSSVTAVLLNMVIGKQLTCIFVDHGLLRLGESEQVIEMFKQYPQINFIHKNEEKMFLNALKGVCDPEQKRKIIGGLFIDVFEKEALKIGDVKFLAQGTLYPDVIESVSFTQNDVVIKSHHNVGGLPERMNMKLVEPLRELFKDEVRVLAKELNLPNNFIARHPFPGPGLAIRIIGDITKQKCDILRKIDAIFIEQIKTAGLYDKIWQAFAVLLPIKTVGVMGDKRTYDNVCALRAVSSTDGMSADVYPFESEFLTHLATTIVNQVKGVNRVVYDHTSKPPGTIEWE